MDNRFDRRDPRDMESATSWGWVWAAFLIIVLVAAFGWWGWGWDRSPARVVTREMPSTALSDNIGQTVTLTGQVGDVNSPYSFMVRGDTTFENQEVLVLSRKPLNEQPVNVSAGTDRRVKVAGEIRKFSRAEFEKDYGLRLDDADLAQFEGKPVIVADSIQSIAAPAPDELSEPR